MSIKVLDVIDEAGAKQFNKDVKSGLTFVLYYSPQCGHCVELKPEWDAMIENIKQKYRGDALLAKVRADMMKNITCDKEVIGFPTMFLLENGGKKKEYNSSRTRDALEKFAQEELKLLKKQMCGKSRKHRRHRRRKTRRRKTRRRVLRRRRKTKKRRRRRRTSTRRRNRR